MEYRAFVIQAFEHEPGKWRARIRRVDGKAIMVIAGKNKLAQFITGLDATTAEAALLMAIAAIDAETFTRTNERQMQLSKKRDCERRAIKGGRA